MPRLLHSAPKYRLHRASGQAIVSLNGKDHYLGLWRSKASKIEYDRLIGEWMASGRQASADPAASGLTIVELIARYWKFVDSYYICNGQPTGEPERIRYAMKPVKRLYGQLAACAFGPVALKAVRQSWVDAGLGRAYINQRIGRIRRMFKWAVAEELLPPSVLQALQAVEGLRFGRTEAAESQPVKPVPDAWVDAVLPCVCPTVRAMIQLQRLTGMRAGEVCAMRAIDIDTRGPIWVYEPASHKNQWRGHRRAVPLGPKAQAIIKDFLRPSVEEFLFQPQRAVDERNEEKRRLRKSKVQPSQVDRRTKHPLKQPGDRYDPRAYSRAITYGIKKAGCPHWHSHQLRHSHGTEIRRLYGVEAAQSMLGHARMSATEIYAERNLDSAIKIAREVG